MLTQRTIVRYLIASTGLLACLSPGNNAFGQQRQRITQSSPAPVQHPPSSALSTIAADTNSITWVNADSLGVDLEVKVRTQFCSDESQSLYSGSLGPRESAGMSCHNYEGVCYRFKHPQDSQDWSDWYGVACQGQTMRLP